MTDHRPSPIDRSGSSGLRASLSFDPGRGLRGLAGVDEELLRQVWHERSRHTALGGVVLGTATIAAFSMWIAINEALGAVSAWALVPAAIWLLFVLNLDRLLVTSMVGSGRRAGTLLMRLLVAGMFGFIIAEPLVIRIFQTAIEQHIRDERTQAVDDLRTKLVDCNGQTTATSADTTVPAGCASYVLSFEKTPAAIQRELTDGRNQETLLQQKVDGETAELNRLRENANRECGGARGEGFTGVPGYGEQCRQRIADAEEYARIHPIAENAKKLVELRQRLTQLEQDLTNAQASFERERDAKIKERVDEALSHQGRIGFLERLGALNDLASSSFALFVASWAIRFFFVTVDCLPVVVKFFGGTSGYDELFRIRAGSVKRVYAEEQKTEETEVIGVFEKRQDEAEHRARVRRAEMGLELQEHKAQMKMRLGNAVSALATQLRQAPRQRSNDNGHQPETAASARE